MFPTLKVANEQGECVDDELLSWKRVTETWSQGLLGRLDMDKLRFDLCVRTSPIVSLTPPSMSSPEDSG